MVYTTSPAGIGDGEALGLALGLDDGDLLGLAEGLMLGDALGLILGLADADAIFLPPYSPWHLWALTSHVRLRR
jgi:hypothetical protein